MVMLLIIFCSYVFLQKAHKRGLSVKKTKRKRDYTSMKSVGVKSIDETFKVCTKFTALNTKVYDRFGMISLRREVRDIQ